MSTVEAVLSLSDVLRRTQGTFIEACGFGPSEASWREILSRPGFRLRQYAAAGHPALIVAAPIKRPYIWDIRPGNSVVRRLMAAGFAVHLAEWLPVPMADFIDLDHCVGGCLGDALETVASHGQSPVVLLGHSLGGTLAAMAACLRPEVVGALVLLEAPLHFGQDSGPLAAAARMADPSRLTTEHAETIPGSFLDLLAVVAAPDSFVGWRVLDFAQSLVDPRALRQHALVERWTLDEFAMAAPLFRQVMMRLYRHDLFLRGLLPVAGRHLGPALLTAPVLAVVDPASAVAPVAAVQPFLDASAANVRDLVPWPPERGCALPHVAMLVGDNAHRRLWPAIIDWINQSLNEARPH